MKKWQTPTIQALDINRTEHNWTGIYKDGGYIGDGIISGHLSCDKPNEAPGNEPAATTAPTAAPSATDSPWVGKLS